jgi:hypothetical protein
MHKLEVRNLYAGVASELIVSATAATYLHWTARYGVLPQERLRTEIGIHSVKSGNPGQCYRIAGWVDDRVVRGKLYMFAPERENLGRILEPSGAR